MNIDWKTTRAILLVISAITGGFLIGVIPALSGFDLSTQILGFDFKILLGILNFVGLYLIWKKL